jgi:hypothetical protein
MTSPYLDRVRPPRETIEELVLAREHQLAEPIAALQRQRVERDLMFLRAELARIGGQDFGAQDLSVPVQIKEGFLSHDRA